MRCTPSSIGAAPSLHSSGSCPRFPSPFAPGRVSVGRGGESRVAVAGRRTAQTRVDLVQLEGKNTYQQDAVEALRGPWERPSAYFIIQFACSAPVILCPLPQSTPPACANNTQCKCGFTTRQETSEQGTSTRSKKGGTSMIAKTRRNPQWHRMVSTSTRTGSVRASSRRVRLGGWGRRPRRPRRGA